MRVLVVSDLHYSLRQWDWLVTHAGRFDAVVVAGDLLDLASAVDLDAQILVMLKYLTRVSGEAAHLLVTSGNHDLEEADGMAERTAGWLRQASAPGVRVDWEGCDLAGWRFTLCPWWEGPEGRERVAAQLEREAAHPKERWVWIHHAPPTGARISWTGKHDAGDEVLAGWIRKHRPDLVLCGHIHQAPFKAGGGWYDRVGSTWVVNTGHYLAPEPPYVVLETDPPSIEWNSAAGCERAELVWPGAGEGEPGPPGFPGDQGPGAAPGAA